jgi:hypothetical protein
MEMVTESAAATRSHEGAPTAAAAPVRRRRNSRRSGRKRGIGADLNFPRSAGNLHFSKKTR